MSIDKCLYCDTDYDTDTSLEEHEYCYIEAKLYRSTLDWVKFRMEHHQLQGHSKATSWNFTIRDMNTVELYTEILRK